MNEIRRPLIVTEVTIPPAGSSFPEFEDAFDRAVRENLSEVLGLYLDGKITTEHYLYTKGEYR